MENDHLSMIFLLKSPFMVDFPLPCFITRGYFKNGKTKYLTLNHRLKKSNLCSPLHNLIFSPPRHFQAFSGSASVSASARLHHDGLLQFWQLTDGTHRAAGARRDLRRHRHGRLHVTGQRRAAAERGAGAFHASAWTPKGKGTGNGGLERPISWQTHADPSWIRMVLEDFRWEMLPAELWYPGISWEIFAGWTPTDS